jgi:DNA-binding NarL/FixJ family response regulator
LTDFCAHEYQALNADDHPVVREGLAAVLKGTNESIVGEAFIGNEAIGLAVKLQLTNVFYMCGCRIQTV